MNEKAVLAGARTQQRQRQSGTFGPRWTALRGWYAYELRKRYGATYRQLGATLQLSGTRVGQLIVKEEAKRRLYHSEAS